MYTTNKGDASAYEKLKKNIIDVYGFRVFLEKNSFILWCFLSLYGGTCIRANQTVA